MTVDSYPELFTTLFGWQFYGVIWDTLSDTGIVYIPFIIILVRNWMEPAKGGDFGNLWSLSLKRMEIEFYLAVFIAMIAGAPALTLSATLLTYHPADDLTGPRPAATVASPQSSYGTSGAFDSAPAATAVPVWWYTVMVLSKGINHAIIKGLPAAIGIRQVQQQAQLATIPDPALREEAGQFFNDCYLPARSRYLREKPTNAALTVMLDDFGQDDPEWMGSHVYRTLYYANMRSQRRVVGWPYDPARDRDYDPAAAPTYTWGQPTCQQWWEDATKGLRKKIADTASGVSSLDNHLSSAVTKLSGFFPSLTSAAEKTTDWTVRAALSNARVDAMQAYQPDDFGTFDRSGIIENFYGAAKDTVGFVGAAWTHATTGTKIQALKPMLPIAQALILLAIYTLLPLIVVFSAYSLGMVVTAAIGIFTVNFWTVLWKIGEWVDENLMLAMHPGTMDGILSWSAGSGGFIGDTSKAMIFDTMLGVFMIGMPLLWSAMMAWIGMNAFRALSTNVLQDAKEPAEDAGQKGGQLAGGTIMRGKR